jgi:hypothetical protein
MGRAGGYNLEVQLQNLYHKAEAESVIPFNQLCEDFFVVEKLNTTIYTSELFDPAVLDASIHYQPPLPTTLVAHLQDPREATHSPSPLTSVVESFKLFTTNYSEEDSNEEEK